jgi:hypothetical protein
MVIKISRIVLINDYFLAALFRDESIGYDPLHPHCIMLDCMYIVCLSSILYVTFKQNDKLSIPIALEQYQHQEEQQLQIHTTDKRYSTRTLQRSTQPMREISAANAHSKIISV